MPTTSDKPTEMRVWPVQMIRVDACEPHPENPNRETGETFDTLVGIIDEDGFDQNIVVIPHPAPHDAIQYLVVKGNHRWKAAKSLDYEEIPAVVRTDWNELEALTRLVRDNVVRGALDKTSFTALTKKMRREYELDYDLQARLFGFDTTQAMLKHMVWEKRDKAVKAALDADQKANAQEDLTAVINVLLTRYGKTLAQSWMAFVYGGRAHLMVEMDEKLTGYMEQLTGLANERRVDINVLLAALVRDGLETYRLDWIPKEAAAENPLRQAQQDVKDGR